MGHFHFLAFAMSATPPPVTLDLRPLADGAVAGLHGDLLLDQLPRVRADAPSDWNGPVPQVAWQVHAEWRQPLALDWGGVPKPLTAKVPAGFPPGQQLWLHLEVQTQVPLTCQRCLQPYRQAVAVNRWFRFVMDEAQAMQEDDEVPEDLLVWTPKFNLLELIEDEILLDLPLIPKHDECTHAWQPKPEAALQNVQARTNPFELLAQLKHVGGKGFGSKKGPA